MDATPNPGSGNSHIKRTGGGCSSDLSGIKNAVRVPLRVRTIAGTFELHFRVLSLKKMFEIFKNQLIFNFVSELVPHRGKKKLKPRPQNKILVPSLSSPVLFIWETPSPCPPLPHRDSDNLFFF